MASRPGLAAPQRPQWGTAEGRGSEVSTNRHPNGARPEHGVLVRREYSLLAPEEPASNPDAVEPQDRRDGPKATMGTGGPDDRATDTGDQNRQRALLTCSQPEDADVER